MWSDDLSTDQTASNGDNDAVSEEWPWWEIQSGEMCYES
jgi:hypothetical protein